MKSAKIELVMALGMCAFYSEAQMGGKGFKSNGCVVARAPLRQDSFIELPLGAIKPNGWLREMLLSNLWERRRKLH